MTLPEYTIGAGAAAAVTTWMDLKGVRTRVLGDRRMPVVGALILFFMLVSNGWLTSRPIVIYDDSYRMLPRLLTMPIEDLLFAFALVIQSLMWWEVAKRRARQPWQPATPPTPCASRSRGRGS